MVTILGAGLSGISTADHLQKKGIAFQIFEGKDHGGGHIHSEYIDGFTWDEGPHVSFTNSDYVRKYFEKNSDNNYLEYATLPSNYYHGSWIPHPAQTNLFAIPEKLRKSILAEVENLREDKPGNYEPANYQDWLEHAFGKTFSKNFPEVYTEKYWTVEPAELSTDWIGKRIHFPDISDMSKSAEGPLDKQTHYISKVRYPSKGGFYSFIRKVEQSLPIKYNQRLEYISFDKKQLHFSNRVIENYETLVNTLPLPEFIKNSDAPEAIKSEASKLKCSQLLLINVVASHPARVPYHWIYVYDREMYSTRINFTELLANSNGINGKTGIQVEVYFSDDKKPAEPVESIVQNVLEELVTMKLIDDKSNIETYHSKWINWANVIFNNERSSAQNNVFEWLSEKGMTRESDDLDPMTHWEKKLNHREVLGKIILAGRFAQWKYFWTDDCVLRGKYISENIG